MADADDEEARLRFEKVVTWVLSQVGPHIKRVTGVLNRLECYMNLKVPADPPESQRHVLFRFLELLKNLVDHARRVELAMTSAPRNFRSEHAKPLFPLGEEYGLPHPLFRALSSKLLTALLQEMGQGA